MLSVRLLCHLGCCRIVCTSLPQMPTGLAGRLPLLHAAALTRRASHMTADGADAFSVMCSVPVSLPRRPAALAIRLPLSPSAAHCNGEASILQPLGSGAVTRLDHAAALYAAPDTVSGAASGATAAYGGGKKRSYAMMQNPALMGAAELRSNELLPGRNVVLAAGRKDSLAFQLLPLHWCW